MAQHIHRVTPFLHVADVRRSIAFYAILGFAVDSTLAVGERIAWAMLASGTARLMLASASGPVSAEAQAALLYLYCDDLERLRSALGAGGVRNAGPLRDGAIERCAFHDITRPSYMPEGEMRVVDPDGYCLLVGQAA